jgi:hypothetical protein
MKNKPFFKFNSTFGVGRKESLHVENFLSDLKELFEKHKVNIIQDGFIGFNKDGEFGISGADIDISEKQN